MPGVIPMKAPTTWARLRPHSPQSGPFRGERDSGRSRSRQLISGVGSVLGQAARTAGQIDRSKNETAVLFSMSDTPILTAFGFYREEAEDRAALSPSAPAHSLVAAQ